MHRSFRRLIHRVFPELFSDADVNAKLEDLKRHLEARLLEAEERIASRLGERERHLQARLHNVEESGGTNGVEARVSDILGRAIYRTNDDHQPRGGLNELFREEAWARWNSKVLGSALAQELYRAGVAGPNVKTCSAPTYVGLRSKLCQQADIEQPWLHYWCGEMRLAPIYHRKIWEDAFVAQALWEADMLRAGRRGLGFAVGAESMPALFAAREVDVLATDLHREDARVSDWRPSGQHVGSLEGLFQSQLVDEDVFARHCSFRAVDMNSIPKDLDGQFDFCWSICAFEHLGSIERGLQFVLNSLKCLKPGGIAVHTTEYNIDAEETIDNWPTVLFQRRHIEDLAARIAAVGDRIDEVSFDSGGGVLDQFVDLPPWDGLYRGDLTLPQTPHLRLSVDGFPATSIGLIIHKT